MRTRRNDEARIRAFRRAVWAHYRTSGRHGLPWRKTTDPYRILVSEVMLQQTQVSRVLEKYRSFLTRFPTMETLAKAPLSAVLKEWSGLGYNRRGKYLHDAAKRIVSEWKGDMSAALAQPLPGVGPYTRAAVRVFAFNEPHTMIETNIRAAYIHHFFDTPTRSYSTKLVYDRDIVPLMERAAEGQGPREWHWALMDYGAHLKKLHPNPTRRSAHYGMQSTFEGSRRQVRGAILRLLSDSHHGDMALAQKLDMDARRVREALSGLKKDGLVVAEKGSWRIA